MVDTFNRYFEPENVRAACEVLRAAGYAVNFPRAADPRPLCCGRTFLASGLVDEAKAEARRMVNALLPYVERGVSVVGLEPSCLFGLRDEFLSMLPGAAPGEFALTRFVRGFTRASWSWRFTLKLEPCRRRRRCCTATAIRKRSP